MANVFDVAKYILTKKGMVSTWKLQKLCYYAQAWTLAWTDKPLFEEDFQAYANGPVCPELFHAHQGKYSISAEELLLGDVDALTCDEKDSVDRVIAEYGDMQPYELREMTHHERPWIAARKRLREGAYCNNIISKESMAEYYGSL